MESDPKVFSDSIVLSIRSVSGFPPLSLDRIRKEKQNSRDYDNGRDR